MSKPALIHETVIEAMRRVVLDMELRSLIGEDFEDGLVEPPSDSCADPSDGPGGQLGYAVIHHAGHNGFSQSEPERDFPLCPVRESFLSRVPCYTHFVGPSERVTDNGMPEIKTVYGLRKPPTENISAMAKISAWRKRFVEAWSAFDRIKGDRTKAGEFAAALGWPMATFTDISTADVPPRSHRIDDISRVTGLHPGWLGHGVEPKYIAKDRPAADGKPATGRKAG